MKDEEIQISRVVGIAKHLACLRNRRGQTYWSVCMLAYNGLEYIRCFSDVAIVDSEGEAVATAMTFIKKLDDKKYLKNLCSISTEHEAGERE